MLVVRYKQDHMEKKSLVQRYQKVFNISAWSFVLVVSTVGMALFGMWLDQVLNTQPLLMVGFCAMANWATLWRLYQETKR